jgi:hypothetical protein
LVELRVVVPAAAGSSPVAHLHKAPANGHVRSEADRAVLRDGDITGTVSSSTTAGTSGEESGDEPPLRFVGDELDLYGEFHFELRKTVASRVRASWEVIEDACSFAWLEFRAAIDELKKLPPLLQEVVVMSSQVRRQQDVADLMGLSRQRVAFLLVQAAQRVAQLNEERHEDERPVASPTIRTGLRASASRSARG